jgi:solute carrier family 39 (zinc transporter), member 9
MSAIISYCALTWFGIPTAPDETSAPTGIALLFSGGTFLYVATLLTPLSADAHAHVGEPSTAEAGLHRWGRLVLIICGMFTPAMIAGLVGHGH